MITLLTGDIIDPGQVHFDDSTYHFFLNSQDITGSIKRADKLAYWPTFDPTVDNARIYNESRGGTGPIAPLDESTFDIFTQQIETDPLGAPLDALDTGVKKVLASSGVQTIGLVLGGGLVLILAVLILKKT